MQGPFGHPTEGEVLLVSDTCTATGIFAGEIGQLVELLGLDISKGQLDCNRPVSLLLLDIDVGLKPSLEVRGMPVRAVPAFERGGVQGLVLKKEEWGWIE